MARGDEFLGHEPKVAVAPTEVPDIGDLRRVSRCCLAQRHHWPHSHRTSPRSALSSVSDADRGLLDSIFVNTAQTIARILERNTTEESIQSTITNFWRYQLAGLAALLRHLADQADGPGDAM